MLLCHIGIVCNYNSIGITMSYRNIMMVIQDYYNDTLETNEMTMIMTTEACHHPRKEVKKCTYFTMQTLSAIQIQVVSLAGTVQLSPEFWVFTDHPTPTKHTQIRFEPTMLQVHIVNALWCWDQGLCKQIT